MKDQERIEMLEAAVKDLTARLDRLTQLTMVKDIRVGTLVEDLYGDLYKCLAITTSWFGDEIYHMKNVDSEHTAKWGRTYLDFKQCTVVSQPTE